jgi:phenylalanyl-tRNA synthetase beta chain
MLVSYRWLSELTGVTEPAEQVAERLVQAGFEVERLQEVEVKVEVDSPASRDVVMDVSITPNRPDCLGHVGLARELAVLTGTSLSLPTGKAGWIEHPPQGQSTVRIEIADSDRCGRYATVHIQGVRVAPSPVWMQSRLQALGIRPINNVVDCTNYVLLEWGYPTHAFDFHRLKDRLVSVRRAVEGESMHTLDGQRRTLTTDDLLICDGAGPVAIAGVMGGATSEVTDNTTELLLECAYFDPRSVRRTSRRLGLHTEASHRFERGVDPLAVRPVLERLATLIAEVSHPEQAGQGGANRCAMTWAESSPVHVEPSQLRLRHSRLERKVGRSYSVHEVQDTLRGLGCELSPVGVGAASEPAAWSVLAPSWRTDLKREDDLIEEVARVLGYGTIEPVLPAVVGTEREASASFSFLRSLKLSSIAAGLHEAINYSFVSPEHANSPAFAAMGGATGERKTAVLSNPLSEERSVMRTSLLPGLLQNVQRAERHQVTQASLFELARVFFVGDDGAPCEQWNWAAVWMGPRGHWLGQPAAADFYDMKNVVQSVVAMLGAGAPASAVQTVYSPEEIEKRGCVHPARAALIRVGEHTVGCLGELHPDVQQAFDLSSSVMIAELHVAELQRALGELSECRAPLELPKYPAVLRDVSLVVPELVQAGQLVQVVREVQDSRVQDVRVVDVYQGVPIDPSKKSVTLRVSYRDATRTLRDSDVDALHGSLLQRLQSAIGSLQSA